MAAFRTTFEVRRDPSSVYATLSQPENLPLLMPDLERANLLDGDGGEASLLDLVMEGGRHVYGRVQRAEPGLAWEVVDQDGRRISVELQETAGRTVACLTIETNEADVEPEALGSEIRSRLAKLLVSLEATG